MAARGFAAFLFVAVFGWVLAQPILRSDSDPSSSGTDERSSATPAPSASERSAPKSADRRRVRIPFDCTGSDQPVVQPDSDLIAAASGNGVSLARTDGGVLAELDARPPVGFSVSGILATGRNGALWLPDGAPWKRGEQQISIGPRWGWSQDADCAATISKTGALDVRAYVGTPPGARARVFDDGVESFSFSPSGRWLAVARRHEARAELWLVDLPAEKVRLLERFPLATCCVTLGGWTPSGREVLFWAGPGASVMADGWPLESVRLGGSRSERATAVPGTELESCGGELVGLVGGDRSRQGARLAVLNRGQERFLTDPSDRVSSFSCSPDANFFVVATDARLALLDRDGDFIRYLTNIDTPNGQWSEGTPEWGPPRTGVLFHRGLHLQSLLWFVPEGIGADHPVIELKPLRGRFYYDWSATQPSGLPTG